MGVCQFRQTINQSVYQSVIQTVSLSVHFLSSVCLSGCIISRSALSVFFFLCVCVCLSVSRTNEVKISLPEHDFPSAFRLYPGRHRHSYPRRVFTQICSQGPNPLLLEHSSSSERPAIDKKTSVGDVLKGQLY